MREGIHPKYMESTVICACGNTFKTHSTKPLIKLEICSQCHPFFTGRQKLVDSAGRVEKFSRKYKEVKIAEPKQKKPKIKKEKIKKKKVFSTTPRKFAQKIQNKTKRHAEGTEASL